MCVVSMITQYYIDKWGRQVPYHEGGGTTDPNTIPWQDPNTTIPYQAIPFITYIPPQISPAEVTEFRELLERAREYDKRNSEPSCELDEKKQALLEIARNLGVKIDFL